MENPQGYEPKLLSTPIIYTLLDISVYKDIKEKMRRTSMVRINFDKKQFLTVTKDAKITVPDMIGNVGGTLGVFIGFSFLGLLDTIIEFYHYLKKKNIFPQKAKSKHLN